MDDFLKGVAFGLCLALFFMVVMFTTRTIERETDYKRGQIDAQNGKIHWMLEKQDDGTVTWVFKK